MKGNNKLILAIAILVVIILILLITFFVRNRMLQNNAISNANQNEVTNNIQERENDKEEELTIAELSKIENILNQEENIRFLYSSYTKMSEVNLYFVFSRPKYIANENERERYEELTNTELTSPLYKVPTEEIKNILTLKFGAEDVKEINKEDLMYLEEEDSYYFINCDDLSMEITCTSGTKKNNEYVVNYETKEDSGFELKGTIKLYIQESDFAYFIISNKVERTNLY